MSKIKVSDIVGVIEKIAPPVLQESYDNSGLIIGSPETEVSDILFCLDSTEEVIEEAISKNCNLVIAHHPIIFNGLKKINGKNYVERTVIKAIQNNICIYAAHTNLDNVINGVNKKIADKIGLKNIEILKPKDHLLKKLVTFCPPEHSEKIRNALFSAGAGHVGNYDSCSFSLEGIGTFRGNEQTNPFLGTRGELSKEKEIRIEIIFPTYLTSKIIQALLSNHPYEEVAYDIYHLENKFQSVGSGLIGELEDPISETEFLDFLKKKFGTATIRHSSFLNRQIKKVALCGGSGSFLLKDAINSNSDIYISSDFKYHEFFDAENKILIADIGHFESEQFTIEIFYDVIKEKFPIFALRFSEIKTNPVNYY